MSKLIKFSLSIITTALLAACNSGGMQTSVDTQSQTSAPRPQLSASPAETQQELAPNVVRLMHWDQVFTVNDDGSVSPRGPIYYHGISLGGPGIKFGRGVSFGGIDFAALQGHDLNAHFEGQMLVIDNFL
jgi:hypothetical protein